MRHQLPFDSWRGRGRSAALKLSDTISGKKKKIQQQQQEKQVKNRSLLLLLVLLKSHSNRTCPSSLREGVGRFVGYFLAVVQYAMQFIYLETTVSESLFTIHLLITERGAAGPSASAAAAAFNIIGFGFCGSSAVLQNM